MKSEYAVVDKDGLSHDGIDNLAEARKTAEKLAREQDGYSIEIYQLVARVKAHTTVEWDE